MRFLVIALSLFVFGCSSLFQRNQSRSAPAAQPAPVVSQPAPVRGTTQPVRRRVLVLPVLDTQLNRSEQLRVQARNVVVSQLAGTGRFVIMRNQDFPEEFSKYLTEEYEYNLEEVSKVASKMGVSAVIEGKILNIGARRSGDRRGLIRSVQVEADAVVRIRMASAKNGRIILEDVRRASVTTETRQIADGQVTDRRLENDPRVIEQSVSKAFSMTLGELVRAVEKISWEGRVALVNGDRIYVNAGRLSGIQVGDVLKITEPGQEVFDPDTGLFIGRAPGRTKGTIEVVSYFVKDGAIAVVHWGSGFKENDRVELY